MRRGFEAYSSASALILAAKKKAEENKDSLLYKLVEGDVEKMNAKIPFDAAQSGDKAGSEVIEEYLGHKPSIGELRHYLAYTAIAAYCWYLWAIYQEANSVDTGEFLKMWYDYSYLYYNKSIELYKNN